VTDLRRSGPWTETQVREFLNEAKIPMRLAANTSSGFPVLLSLWFLSDGEELLAAVHRDSRIVTRLRADSRCAFEIAPNEPPYFGVRGQGIASLEPSGAPELLERLLHRYLGGTESKLGRFLLGRAEEELVVRLTPSWVGSWDYRERMKDPS
jgi:hypothetical protein